MANNGWIKLYRDLLKSPMWTSSIPEHKTILITLLLMVTHGVKKGYMGNQEVTVEPGQVITSLADICDHAGMGVTKENVRGALLKFEKLGFLTQEATKTGRLISIVNWGVYQGDANVSHIDMPKDVPKVSHRCPNGSHTKQEDKEIKNVKNVEEVETRADAHEDCCWYYQNRIGMVNPTIAEDIMTFESIMPGDLINAAIDEAARNNARWAYAKAILQRCKDNNILTLDAFNADKKSKSTKKSSSPGPAQKGNYDSRTYSDEFLDGLYQNGG